MKKDSFVLRGGIVYSKNINEIEAYDGGYLVCEDGSCKGAFPVLLEKYKDLPLIDFGDMLIMPGMTDLHVHAPQYTFRGIGMDEELLTWLNKYTFPEEAKYKDIEYAKKAYDHFSEDLRRSFTTRAVVYGTIHNEATIALMEKLEKTGIISFVGKVNMDRNGSAGLQESSAAESLKATEEWLEAIAGRFKNTKPILTPRFIPSCSDELMRGLGELAKEKGLRIQSHLSENKAECAWVKELVPSSSCYANAYELFGAMGSNEFPSIMAHCVYSGEEEISILKKHGAFVAHCADSNMNLSSGIAPVRKLLDAGINVGLGTDVAAGSSMNLLKTVLITIQASKMYYRLVDNSAKPLSFEEAFYLATMGGGKYFGKVGTFQEGYEFDAVVIDDSLMKSMRDMSVRERIERICYNDSDAFIVEKYVGGKKIYSRTR